jgi:hypothetical protein
MTSSRWETGAPLVTADITHARLQKRFGDGEDAFASEGLAGAKPQRVYVFLEGAFHSRRPTVVV